MILMPPRIYPKCVNIHHGKGAVPFFRDLDLFYLPFIVNKSVLLEELLINLPPALAVKLAQYHYPIHWIMVIIGWRPGPDHIRVKYG